MALCIAILLNAPNYQGQLAFYPLWSLTTAKKLLKARLIFEKKIFLQASIAFDKFEPEFQLQNM